MGLSVYPIVARQRLSKHVPAATKNCCRLCFLCGPCRIKGKEAISSSNNFLFFYSSLLIPLVAVCYAHSRAHVHTHIHIYVYTAANDNTIPPQVRNQKSCPSSSKFISSGCCPISTQVLLFPHIYYVDSVGRCYVQTKRAL
jgi:hypothetical protein